MKVFVQTGKRAFLMKAMGFYPETLLLDASVSLN